MRRTKRQSKPKKRSRHDRRLMRLAADVVPRGSGIEELGEGEFSYIKLNIHDGSARILSFESEQACREAAEEGMAADAARELARTDPGFPRA